MTDLRQQLQSTLTGSYTIERELGGGGMSRVFVADETRLSRKVVVKVLAPELAAGISAERFLREIKLAASLQQANIVPVLSAGDSHGLPYYTMPYVEGESLRKRLATGTPMSVTEILRVLGDVARALSYAHEHGIVHRDIKPDNVLLSHGTAVVTDFGIAKALSAARTGDGAATLTQLGASIGTPAYMAPEQAAGDDDVDHRVDIYAFGCLAYELLSGRPPFSAKTAQRLLAAQMSETPTNVTELRADTPADLSDLVMRCLAKDPAGRPQRATDLMKVLDSVTSGGAPALPSVLIGGPAMFKRALMTYAGAFVAVAILARAAIIAIGLPDWVFPGALVVMALGLPVVLFAGYAHRTTMRALTMTPPRTPGGGTVKASTMATLAVKAGPHLSWSRVARGGGYTLGAFGLVVGGFMTLRAMGIGPAGSLFGKGELAFSDRLLVGEFRSPSSDSALGTVISEALRQSLSQSRAIHLASPTSVAEGLGRMQRKPTERLELQLARDLSEREGYRAIVHGDITSAGTGFIITARLTNAKTGAELTSFRAAARDAADLIPAVDKLARDLRGKIGESLRSVHASPPLMKVTTASLPALREFTEGMRLHYQQADYVNAARTFEKAIAMDSTFASAYARAANAWVQSATRVAHRDSLRVKALTLGDRLPEAERYMIRAFINPVRDSARQFIEASLAADPDQSVALNLLGNNLMGTREYARAEAAYRRGIALNDGNRQPGGNLVSALVSQGRFAEARAQIREMEPRYPNGDPTLLSRNAVIALLEGNYDQAESMLLAASKMPRSTISRAAASYLASFYTERGRPNQAMRLRDSLVFQDEAVGNRLTPVSAIDRTMNSIYTDVIRRDQPTVAVRRLDVLLAKHPPASRGGISLAQLAFAAQLYGRSNRPDLGRKVLALLDSLSRDTVPVRRPPGEYAQFWIAAAEQNLSEALRLAARLDTAFDGRPIGCGSCMVGLFGVAYDRAGMADSAIKYYEAFLTAPYYLRWGFDEGLFGTSQRRLGELYEAKGNVSKAAEHYRNFVNLWARAEPELQPKVAEVRRRLARLAELETKR